MVKMESVMESQESVIIALLFPAVFESVYSDFMILLSVASVLRIASSSFPQPAHLASEWRWVKELIVLAHRSRQNAACVYTANIKRQWMDVKGRVTSLVTKAWPRTTNLVYSCCQVLHQNTTNSVESVKRISNNNLVMANDTNMSVCIMSAYLVDLDTDMHFIELQFSLATSELFYYHHPAKYFDSFFVSPCDFSLKIWTLKRRL